MTDSDLRKYNCWQRPAQRDMLVCGMFIMNCLTDAILHCSRPTHKWIFSDNAHLNSNSGTAYYDHY